MKQKIYIPIYLLLLISLSIFWGYGRIIIAQEIQNDMNKIDIVQEFKLLNNDMNAALGQQVDILSPHNYKIANSYLESAKKNLDKENAIKKVIHQQIITARDYLSKAKSIAKLSHRQMDDVVIARQQAIAAGASVYFASDFEKADGLLQSISADLEKNNTIKVQKSFSSLKNIYSDLELRSIRHQNLAQTGLIILQAIKDGAKEYASEKLEQILRDYKAVTIYIKENRHNAEEIKSRSLAVNKSANQLLQITHEIADAKKNSGEALANVADVVRTQQSSVMPKIEEERIKQIQKQFSVNEAQVYLEGNTLIMRLRGLKFPVSQAVLRDSNLQLLGKVQRIIKDFKNSEVLVEGHTDNVGSKEINERISRTRAQTIKDYLLSADAISADRVKVAARGAEVPLVSNQTPEGRALNRRVDILIKL